MRWLPETPKRGNAEAGLTWEEGLLVLDAPVPADFDIVRLIERHREERMLAVLFGGGRMTAVFDSSVFVAAFLKRHPHHAEAAAWHTAVRNGRIKLVVSAHTLAELYATLTVMPHGLKVTPAQLWRLIDANILPYATLRTLTAARYARLVHRLAGDDVTGAAVYDAVIAEVARRGGVDTIVTFNVRHFARFWPADRLLSPLTSSPPAPDAR